MNTQLKAFIYFMAPILMIAFVVMALSPLTSNVSITPRTDDSTVTPSQPTESSVAAASVWDGTYPTAGTSWASIGGTGAGTAASPYIVDSAAKLAWISANGLRDIAYNKYYKQTVDIDLSSYNWNPINNNPTARLFYYNGGGQTIYNLKINSTFSAITFAGLFGYITASSVIENLQLSGGNIDVTVTGFSAYVGAFVGRTTQTGTIGELRNLHNLDVDVTLTHNGSTGTWMGTGGISGSCGNMIVSNCSNGGEVLASTSAQEWTAVGGVVGYPLPNLLITHCINYGTITETASAADAFAGGIAGIMSDYEISYCENYGDVYAYCTHATGFNPRSGGILAMATSNITIKNSVNHGNVYAKGREGAGRATGVVSYLRGTDVNYFDRVIESCYNTGAVINLNPSGNSTQGVILVAVQTYGNLTVTAFYYNTEALIGANPTVIGSIGVTGVTVQQTNVTGLTTAQMQSSANGVAPSGMIGFTSENWFFNINEYPNITPNGNGTESSPYLIDTAQKLTWISDNAAGAAEYKYFKQTANIDLNNVEWTPINQNATARTYFYDGGGYSISNLKIIPTADFNGLFGRIAGGYIKNVHIASGTVESSGNYTAGLVANVSFPATPISNCSNAAEVIGYTYVGGILGGGPSTITDCLNEGRIYGETYIGGILGGNTTSNGSTIMRCSNDAPITSTQLRAGGIVGFISTAQTSVVSECQNTGSISGGAADTGGIIGRADIVQLSYCANFGAVYGNGTIGGIAGAAFQSTIITRCFNGGSVTAPVASVGGIVGCSGGSIIKQSYNSGNIKGGENVGGILGIFYNDQPVAASTCRVEECFSYGQVNGGGHVQSGGLVGCMTTYNTGLPVILNSFYDTQKIGTSNPPSVAVGRIDSGVTVTNTTGLITTQMKSTANNTLPTGMTSFTASDWYLTANNYPTLKWMVSIELVVT